MEEGERDGSPAGGRPLEVTILSPRHLVLAGELDMGSAADLRRHLDDAVAGGHGDLVLEVHDLAFIDSTGIGVLVGAARRIRHAGDQVVLRSPSERVRQTLAMAGLEALFQIET